MAVSRATDLQTQKCKLVVAILLTEIQTCLIVFLLLTHLRCTGWATLDRQVPVVSCSSREFLSVLPVMVFPLRGLNDLCSNKNVCVCACAYLDVYVCAFICMYLYGVRDRPCLLLCLSRLMSRLRSCCRKPWLGQMSLCVLTAATASRRVRPSTIIRKASTSVAERLTPIRQWTNTRPGTGIV